jgi:Family of unknown function (DUF6072)
MSQQRNPINPVAAGLEFASEIMVPGGSNLVKGDLLQAGIHFVLGYVAKAAFGLPGLALVSANSVTKALTGNHLIEYINAYASQAPAQAAPTQDSTGTVS